MKKSQEIEIDGFSSVYLMMNSKTVKVYLNRFIKYQELQVKIKQILDIEQRFQIIYYKGNLLRTNSMKEITQNTIIHVGDSRSIEEQTLTVYLIEYITQGRNLFKATGVKLCFGVKPNNLVGDALRRGMIQKGHVSNVDDWSFISSGRFLHKDKSFKEQNIQNNAEIELIITNKQQIPRRYLSHRTLPTYIPQPIVSDQQKYKQKQEKLKKEYQRFQKINKQKQIIQKIKREQQLIQQLKKEQQLRQKLVNSLHKSSILTQTQNQIIQQQHEEAVPEENMQNNPQSLIKLEQQQIKLPEEMSRPVLRKIRSAKTIITEQYKPPPMKFSLISYKAKEQLAKQKQAFRNMDRKDKVAVSKNTQSQLKRQNSGIRQFNSPKTKSGLRKSTTIII